MNWIMPDESSRLADDALDRVSFSGGIVPSLFKLEVGNALLVAVRRKRISTETRQTAFEKIGALPLEEDDQGAKHIWTGCINLADRYGLSLYDATYLELALRVRKPLATLDDRLAEAAKQENLSSPWPDDWRKQTRS